MHEAIHATLAVVPFTPENQIAYAQSVKDDLAKRIPGAILDIYFPRGGFRAEAWSGTARARVAL